MRTKERGITLIALVVTIIVLLILAGVSIQMLTGQNGILKMAREASEKTRVAQIEEQIDFAQFESIDMNTAELNKNKLIDKLNKIEGVLEVTEEGEDKVIVTYKGEEGEEVKKEISVGRTVLSSEKEFEDKVKDEIKKEGSYVKAWDAYGNEIVDFENNWFYEERDSVKNEWQLNEDDNMLDINEKNWTAAYKGPIVEGSIIGEIPAYIVKVVDGEITCEGKVSSYRALFANITDFKYLPDGFVVSPIIVKFNFTFSNSGLTEIPECFTNFSKNVTEIEGLFANTTIEEVPKNFTIPGNVRTSRALFGSCEKLKRVGDGFTIGQGVKNIKRLFYRCKELEYIKITIPESVTNIEEIFYHNYKLNGNCSVTIEGNPAEYERAFEGAGKDNETGTNLKVYYYGSKCTNIQGIKDTINDGKVDFIDLELQQDS